MHQPNRIFLSTQVQRHQAKLTGIQHVSHTLSISMNSGVTMYDDYMHARNSCADWDVTFMHTLEVNILCIYQAWTTVLPDVMHAVCCVKSKKVKPLSLKDADLFSRTLLRQCLNGGFQVRLSDSNHKDEKF